MEISTFSLLGSYNANLVAIILVLILYFANKGRIDIRREEKLPLLGMMGVTLVTCISEAIAYTFDGKPGTLARICVYVFNSELFLANLFLFQFWKQFLSLHLGVHVRKLFTYAIHMICVVGFLLLVINPWIPLVFLVDANNVYSRGPFFSYYLICAFVIIADSLIMYAKVVRLGGAMKLFPVWLFLTPICVGIVLQSTFYGLSLIWPCIAVGTTGLLSSLQNETIFRDKLTGLFNRSYLDNARSIMLKRTKSPKITGIMLDLNRFKLINDTYGHSVGDEALVQAAGILHKSAGSRGTAIRYAGDEFVILLNTQDDALIEHTMEAIRTECKRFNQSSGKPYQLSFAMGYEKLDLNHKSMNDFMNEMDKQMYEDKKAYYAKNNNADRRHR